MHTLTRSSLTAVALLAAAGSAFASVEYNVWYQDDNGVFNYGDITDGSAPAMPPPSWACGRRFFSPDHYAWRDHDYSLITAGDFYGPDIDVWVPRPGCAHRVDHNEQDGYSWDETIVVETRGGGTVYSAPLGRHFLALHSHYGSYWINEAGGWPACNCTLANAYLTLANGRAQWGTVSTSISRAATLPYTQSLKLLDQSRLSLTTLRNQLAGAIGERRRKPLATLETTVRVMEDKATAATALAARLADDCRRSITLAATDSARRACGDAAAAVEQARVAMVIVVSELHQSPVTR